MAMSVEDDRQQLTPRAESASRVVQSRLKVDRLLSNPNNHPNNRGPSPLGVAGKAV